LRFLEPGVVFWVEFSPNLNCGAFRQPNNLFRWEPQKDLVDYVPKNFMGELDGWVPFIEIHCSSEKVYCRTPRFTFLKGLIK